ncbi:BamA/TamA family outer membrane protein [Tenacibaculum sp. IB213877]|uniref:translocation and assembly module lipoprotein TamL n=1 Tax=Tenacibaculum sp. IB213877 TaxID=3097351 RepID=UPI002A59E803|nr:BamA/TamA family outer membrane protein [Tenacibaculum sp. IB213877]MDY0781603.1 BamA/TamA family outer membrane protein [Tenacibaculum sp. IB213877]
MKKLSFYFLLLVFLSSCSTIEHVPENELLLSKNIIYIDSVKTSKEKIHGLLLQRPNAKALGLPLSLYFYNLGNPQGSQDVSEWRKNHPGWYNLFKDLFSEKQSISVAKTFIGLNNWYLENGQPPVIIDDEKTEDTEQNLENYFFTEGYFRANVTSKKDSIAKKKGAITYYIQKGKPTFLDSIYTSIESPILDSIYHINKKKSFLRKGEQYKNQNFINEANRIVNLYRNKGIFHFNENNILFEPDTLSNYQKTDVEINISDRLIEENGEYSSKPFKIQKIKNINVFTDYTYELRQQPYLDSVSYTGISFFAHNKLRYNPKYLAQSVFIQPNQIYTDSLRSLTRIHLRGLKNFKSISIRYNEINDDELEANIFLTPIEKYTLGVETELSRSNIRNFDISAKFSLLNRNTFRGAEIFRFSVLGAYFNSRNGPGWELGSNLSLEIPRFMAPFGLHKFVPKSMMPRTTFQTGISIQKNIALDKQNISLGVDYKWQYNERKSIQLELLNAQYIRNLNVDNYFNIYQSEYSKLIQVENAYGSAPNLPNNTPNNFEGIVSFMRTIASDVNFRNENPQAFQDNLNVYNRYRIISSDFLIPEIAYNFTYNNQENVNDASFSFFRARIANSGNVMGLLSKQENANGQKTVFKIPVAQYFKTDLEYKKFWDLGRSTVLAHRTFLGAIITYNGSNIPFSKSYFAGGSNDIRAWRTYDLGPGTRKTGLEYNIGSLKFLSSLEYRFPMVGSIKGAVFMDAGNIWDITNSSFVDEEAKFKNLKSITDMAVAAGFGVRYDLKFLVARLDIGFKAREPYLNDKRWFQNFNFSNAVYNIGINYPF